MKKIFNSFGVNSYGKALIEINTLDDISNYYDSRTSKDLLIVGGGYNILPPDYYGGDVIRSNLRSTAITSRSTDSITIRAGSGLEWDDLVDFSIKAGGFGLEYLSSIPGRVGAAPVQNIGAYGSEVSYFISRVFCFNLSTGTFESIKGADCSFGYRSSIFKARPELFILDVEFRLPTDSLQSKRMLTNDMALNHLEYFYDFFRTWTLLAKSIYISMDPKPRLRFKYSAIRSILLLTVLPAAIKRKVVQIIRRKLLQDPFKVGNSGCYFKNPIVSNEIYSELRQRHPEIVAFSTSTDAVKLDAGWLIKNSSDSPRESKSIKLDRRSAVVLLNKGNATYLDVTSFISSIQTDVRKTFGLSLELEVVVVPSKGI